MTILYIILRSQTGLSSIYHRIMFGLATADIIGSVSMALTSLPMPSYLPNEEEFGYEWAGARLGNTQTCNAQGFLVTLGLTNAHTYNLMLCLYYYCAISLNMTERKIKTTVEPWLHGLPLVVGFGLALPPLLLDLYNPSMIAYAWCAPVPYPYECHWYQSQIDCIRGDAKLMKLVLYIISGCTAALILLIIITLVVVIVKVVQTDRFLKQLSGQITKKGLPKLDVARTMHQRSKAAIYQAAAYILAVILSELPVLLLSSGMVSAFGSPRQQKVGNIMEKIMLLLLPLQGFFNCIIFVCHKVYNYRRVHSHVGICHVLRLLFLSSSHDPTFVSRISIVGGHEEEEKEEEEEQDRHSGYAGGAADRVAEPSFQDDEGLYWDGGNVTNTSSRRRQRRGSCHILLNDESDSEQYFRLSLMRTPRTSSRNDNAESPCDLDALGQESVAEVAPVVEEDDISHQESTRGTTMLHMNNMNNRKDETLVPSKNKDEVVLSQQPLESSITTSRFAGGLHKKKDGSGKNTIDGSVSGAAAEMYAVLSSNYPSTNNYNVSSYSSLAAQQQQESPSKRKYYNV